MLVEPKGADSFKQIEEEVEGDPLKKTAGNMTPAVAKVSLQEIVSILQTRSPSDVFHLDYSEKATRKTATAMFTTCE